MAHVTRNISTGNAKEFSATYIIIVKMIIYKIEYINIFIHIFCTLRLF
jgi:hypothetical protein